MLTFRINEIKQGTSTEQILLTPDLIDTAPYPLLGGTCDVEFKRRGDRIMAHIVMTADFELICDRSTDSFSHTVQARYDVVFDPSITEDIVEESSASHPLNVSKNEFSISDDVRDTLLLAIPLKKIHPRFTNVQENAGEIEQIYADPDSGDPRWEVLKTLLNQKN